ncbi:hypothetical protein O7635_21060 [Asanoa sp. WMMD1127]|uniref:hypothetical protein n=1 Tax=Asanoa sp. WMMD1127 TaxID=3016107 RepID=UPI002415B039|nr:hypothetical protein [Asanoa sp. WMMD1127]MDG4824348.1 hypothetical protein [Asanoa sp. WMMD1127]
MFRVLFRAYPAELFGVALRQSPRSPTLMRAAECLALRGISACPRPVTHGGQLSLGKQLKLPHASIILRRVASRIPGSAIKHANLLTVLESIRRADPQGTLPPHQPGAMR